MPSLTPADQQPVAAPPAAAPTHWRSLNELGDTPAFRQFAAREFPYLDRAAAAGVTRREFLTLMGASMALAGLAGCRRPVHEIVPFVKQPEEIVPGVALHYASTMTLGDEAYGVVVEVHDGRPTKIEGNPLHPASLGGTNAWTQAAVLGLYDPSRSQAITARGAASTWQAFVDAWRLTYAGYKADGGAGLAVLSEASCSPTQARLAANFRKTFPQARWVTYEPVSNEAIYAGAQGATGAAVRPLHNFAKATVILSLESDFLLTESDNVAATRGFADGRRGLKRTDPMNRLYVVENALSVTGGMADHRLRARSSAIGPFALALAKELRGQNVPVPEFAEGAAAPLDANFIKVLASDLKQAGKGALIVAGRRQPAAVHALVAALNAALGSDAVSYVEAREAQLPSAADFAALTADMAAGKVKTLVILGSNPVYTAPADLNFAAALTKVPQSIHLGQFIDETAAASTWHLPQTHFLEQWGDARALDGTLSVIQPMILPLYGERTQVSSTIELLQVLTTGEQRPGLALVQETWEPWLGAAPTHESTWRRTLHDGVLAGSRLAATAEVKQGAVAAFLQAHPIVAAPATGLEVVFAADASVYDGRFANNGWLQEMPDPITKLSWDNAALLSPKTAEKLGVADRHQALGPPHVEVLKVTVGKSELSLPAWIVPGQADDTIILPLGYGRHGVGPNAEGAGANTYTLRTAAGLDFVSGASAAVVPGVTAKMACTQDHSSMEHRPLIRENTLAKYQETGELEPEAEKPEGKDGQVATLYDHPLKEAYKEGYQWGMTIDLSTCTGCNACVVACQSENNIPVVGKERVGDGREMHWIRIDRYFSGPAEDPQMVVQPVPCQHCENAPCETVCPVAATTHDSEGLNTMAYNRCVGTRYCGNNCPYKVRRFNFFNFTKELPESQKLQQNPEVTVRFRGVMEKCSFCVQRISRGRNLGKQENRTLRDGEVQTACQQACPAGAITFGNLNDPQSQVVKLKQLERKYDLLAELNTRPRVSYLGKLRNPHPQLSAKES